MLNHITHLLIVDDDKRIRELLKKFLVENGFVVSTAKDSTQAKEKLEEFIVDLIILDVMMPGQTGYDFARSFRHLSDIPILMLTSKAEVEHRIEGLESGADDYLPKPFEPRELLLRIKKILARTKQFHKEKSIFGNFVFDISTDSLTKNGAVITLTQNEVNLLKTLCKNICNVVSREDMAKACGGVNERTVDVQINRLRNKIEEDPKTPKYLKTIRGKGYILYV